MESKKVTVLEKTLDEYQLKKQNNFLRKEVRQALNNLEKSIIQAGLGIRFKNIPSNFQEGEFRKAVLKICTITGIKTPPDAFLLNTLLDFFRKYYSKITIEEFILAFELNMLEEYKMRFEHYQLFDLDYCTKCIKAFCTARQQAEFNMTNALSKVNTPPIKKMDPKESYDGLKESVKNKNELPIIWDWVAVYDYMQLNNLIIESDKWFKEFNNKIFRKIKSESVNERLRATTKGERDRIDEMLKEPNLNAAYKKEYVKMKFGDLIEKKQ